MEPVSITIDGNRFSTLTEFYEEMERLLTKDLSWTPGRSMDAFHDLLRGGFGVHDYGAAIAFHWIHAEKSRRDLGYEATELYWRQLSDRCHPSNRERMLQRAEAAKRREGPTLFDLITAEILDKESVYDHTLVLDG